MENESVWNKGIVLELSLKSSMVEYNSTNITNKPCTLNLDPYLTLALHDDHATINRKPECDHGSLHRQDRVSGGGSSFISMASVRVKRDRVVKTEEPRRMISTTSEVEDDDDNSVNGRKKLRLTKAQSALLEEAFKHQSTLNPQKRKHELARDLKLRPRQVEVWFQNRRARYVCYVPRSLSS